MNASRASAKLKEVDRNHCLVLAGPRDDDRRAVRLPSSSGSSVARARWCRAIRIAPIDPSLNLFQIYSIFFFTELYT